MIDTARRIGRSSSGAVAPIVALSLFGLIAVGGIAFDYARLATMDTELQDAADQAALAAASQLDGQTGAVTRATAAAQSLLINRTYMANEIGGKTAISVPTVRFYSSQAAAEADSLTGNASTTLDDTAAKFVRVAVASRRAIYALTPFAGFGKIDAEAVAGVSSAICKEPPVMMCNPAADPASFDVSTYIGKGFLLVAKSTANSPGDFGFLDVGAGTNDLGKLIGYGSPPDKCVSVSSPSTQPGVPISVFNDFNTRFDIFESGDSNGCYGSSLCAPSINSRKDLVYKTGSLPSKTDCGIVSLKGGQKGWTLSSTPYRPKTALSLDTSVIPDAMGYPRDLCHAFSATGDCWPNARIGTGDWDIDAYWRVNHPAGSANGAVGGRYPTSLNSTVASSSGISMPSGRTYPTRYMVYKWEMNNAALQLPQRSVSGVGTDYGQPVCRPGLIGSVPSSQIPDRRVIPVAVVNCTGLGGGAKPVTPLDFVDAFLVEPSLDRTGYTAKGEIYVEIVQHTGSGSGGTGAQVVRHDKPYLIK